ncbi:MAG: hypothetical protein FWE27_02655 [Defluviitaleaceae bacterium]|nr:hypothetical protein [Defluviitaleaceae bacterium]
MKKSIYDVERIMNARIQFFGKEEETVSFNFRDGFSVSTTCINRYIHVSRETANKLYLAVKSGELDVSGDHTKAQERRDRYLAFLSEKGLPIIQSSYEHYD